MCYSAQITEAYHTALDARIFPFTYVPIIVQLDGSKVLRLARYHCRQGPRPLILPLVVDPAGRYH